MKDFKVKFELTGAMTQMPDSQKLFGALVYLFAEKYGDERATEFTKAILDNRIHLALSNLMPEGYLPVPHDYLIDRVSKKGSASDDLKKSRTAIKMRSYIRPETLKFVLVEPKNCEIIYPYVKQQNLQQLRASVESIRYNIPELDTHLYSVPTVAMFEISLDKRGNEQNRIVKKYCLYLQTDNSELCSEFLDMLHSVTAEKRDIILGKRSSQGLNVFRLISMIEQDVQGLGGGAYLNTGMLLPNRIDFRSSSIRLFTSERRPFEMIGGWSEDIPKYFISYIAQGSIIIALEGVEQVGKSIQSPFNNRNIVFGNAFLHPVFINEGQV